MKEVMICLDKRERDVVAALRHNEVTECAVRNDPEGCDTCNRLLLMTLDEYLAREPSVRDELARYRRRTRRREGAADAARRQ